MGENCEDWQTDKQKVKIFEFFSQIVSQASLNVRFVLIKQMLKIIEDSL